MDNTNKIKNNFILPYDSYTIDKSGLKVYYKDGQYIGYEQT